jgi:hypothetical protein
MKMNVSLLPQPPTSGSMTGSKKMTDEKFDTIPGLIAEGKTTIEIAALFGVTPGTLKVYCSNRRISLRPLEKQRQRRQPKPVVARPVPVVVERPPVVAEAVQIVSLRLEAKARGMTDVGLVNHLLAIIVKDKLYDAVLGKLEMA